MRAAKVLGEIIVLHVGMLPPASNDNSGRSADEDVVAADDEEIIERALSRLGSDKGGSDE